MLNLSAEKERFDADMRTFVDPNDVYKFDGNSGHVGISLVILGWQVVPSYVSWCSVREGVPKPYLDVYKQQTLHFGLKQVLTHPKTTSHFFGI